MNVDKRMCRSYNPRMAKHDALASHSDAADATVKLKPVLGVRPGTYLTVIYALVVCLFVFFLLFYPGIRNPGSYLTIEVIPGQATVMVDGTFAGTASDTFFVKDGKRKIEIDKAFYTPQFIDLTIRGRIFSTLLFPSRRTFSFRLAVSDPKGLTESALNDFSRNPHIPQIISDAAWAAYRKGEAGDNLYDFISSCMFTVTSEIQLAEIVRAAARTATEGTFLTPANYLVLIQKGMEIKEKYDNSPAWLLWILSREHSGSLLSSPWISRHFTQYRDELSRYYQDNLGRLEGGGAASVLDGIVFRSIPQGTLVMGQDDNLDILGKNIDLLLSHPVSVGAFLMSETEVSNRQYQVFLRENQRWRPSNRAALIKESLATETYLSEWVNDMPSAGGENLPVTSVSYYAATAYCDWLSHTMQASYPGAVARLPSEAEWEWAARGGLRGMPYPLGEKPGKSVFFQTGTTGPLQAGSSEPNGYGLRDMMGNVWEWCLDSYGPSDYLLSSSDPRKNAAFESAHPADYEKVVRGGGWENQKDLVKIYTRGSQPSQWGTPYLGFRVAVTRR
jgi:formylglycine-generating enzyme required for sulfatase activity